MLCMKAKPGAGWQLDGINLLEVKHTLVAPQWLEFNKDNIEA